MIHDNVCESRKLNSVSFEAAELWFRLLTVVDDNGNYYGGPAKVYVNLMEEKKGASQKSTEKSLRDLNDVGLIQIYEADGRTYLHITDFSEHQNLRKDLSADVSYPLHPATFGPAYTKDGERRDKCVRPGNGPERVVTDCSEPETARPLEVEVKGEEEVEGEVDGTELTSSDLKTFKTVFREQTGAKAKIGTKTGEKLAGLCGRYGMTRVLDALPKWVEDEGGKTAIQNDKKKREWASSNFLRDAEEIIEAMKAGVFEPEPAPATGGLRTLVARD